MGFLGWPENRLHPFVTFNRIRKFAGLSFAVFTGLVAVIGAIYGFGLYVDSRVEQHVRSDAFLKKLADAVRPSCVFDQQGAILVDMGAMKFIDSIDVAPLPENDLPPKIVIHPNRYLANAPILTTLDPFSISVSTERGRKFDWVYTRSYVGMAVPVDWKHIRYRLEIVY
jgi:hypothetical protein